MSSISDDIRGFRRFARMYTRFIGALQEKLLGAEYSLAEARVLCELANRAAPRAAEIAGELGLDPGYLSRILAKLERAGMLKRKTSKEDGRYAELALTSRGRAAFGKLNARSDGQARSVLQALPHSGRRQLIASMRAIEGILGEGSGARPRFVLRGHRAGDMGWVVCREAAVYAEEYGFDQSFEALVARIVADFLTNFDPARERCWIADADGESVGHIFLVQHPERSDTAKLRLFFVEPGSRGLGLGRALVKECVQFARAARYRRIVLWTQSNLAAAHHIYVSAGFRLVEEEAHRSFGQDLLGQTWELEL